MLLSPKGIPAHDHILTLPDQERTAALLSLLSQGYKALEYAHEKNVFHLDVSPRNFVFVDGRFILVDWACAFCPGVEVVGFRGSLPYAHAKVHAKARWWPKKEYDTVPLLFTVCALSMGQIVPWPQFTGRLSHSTDPAFVARSEDTVKELQNLLAKTTQDHISLHKTQGEDQVVVKIVKKGCGSRKNVATIMSCLDVDKDQ